METDQKMVGRYCGVSENPHSGVHAAMKGKQIVCVAAGSRDTEEDCEAGSRAARVVIDHFMRRPSLNDTAMRQIMEFANHEVMRMRQPGNGDRLECCDAAILFLCKDTVRWVISGDSRVYHFIDGKIAHDSGAAGGPVLGMRPSYEPVCGEEIPLSTGEHAFLLASPALARKLDGAALQEILSASSGAQDYIDRILERMGEDRQFQALAISLPPKKGSTKPFGARK